MLLELPTANFAFGPSMRTPLILLYALYPPNLATPESRLNKVPVFEPKLFDLIVPVCIASPLILVEPPPPANSVTLI